MATLTRMTDSQLDQMALSKSRMTDIRELDEIPLKGTYYLKNDHKKVHWVWTKVTLMGYNENEELLFNTPTGIKDLEEDMINGNIFLLK